MRGQCANAWSMCKCANGRFNLLRFIACKCFSLQMLSYTKATICTFAHSHICTLMLVHNHLKATIQVARDAIGTDGAHFRYVEALTTT